jgi:antitoxin MazE
MRASVKKWGNSAAIRISQALLAEAGLQIDQPVEVRAEDGRITIAPVQEFNFTLEELVNQITPENQRELIDFGRPRGKEVW